MLMLSCKAGSIPLLSFEYNNASNIWVWIECRGVEILEHREAGLVTRLSHFTFTSSHDAAHFLIWVERHGIENAGPGRA